MAGMDGRRVMAVTGGIATGKSTVLEVFRGVGLACASADEVARGLWEEGEFRLEVGALLGLAGEGSRSEARARMGDSVFRSGLNRLTHAAVWRGLEYSGAEVWEVPLVFEAAVWRRFSRILVLGASREVVLGRLALRLGDSGLAESLLGSQVGFGARGGLGDWVLRTDGDLSFVLETSGEIARLVLGELRSG